MTWQEESLHAVLHCKTTAEVFGHLQEETRRLGMERVSWVLKLPFPLLNRQLLVFNTYPKAWEERYIANNYLAVDPTVRHGMRSVLPVLWNCEAMRQTPEFWEEAHSFGLKVGVAQSVFDSQGCCSMLSLCRETADFTPTEIRDKAPKINWLAQLIHAGMMRLVAPWNTQETAARLTAREKEVLQLIAAGMTSQAIADRLHLSKRTADFHIEAAMSRLGAENRIDAGLRALALIDMEDVNEEPSGNQAATATAGGQQSCALNAVPLPFTDRELDILRWAALGKSASVTAQILGISEKTVRKSRETAGRKLNSYSITQSVAAATRLGLL